MILSEQETSARLDELVPMIAPGESLLVIIPDATRTAPIPMMFRLLCQKLHDKVAALTFLIALGTHKLMEESEIDRLVGMSRGERERRFPRCGWRTIAGTARRPSARWARSPSRRQSVSPKGG